MAAMAGDDDSSSSDITTSLYGSGSASPADASPADAMTDSSALPALDGADEASGEGSFTETESVSWFDKLIESAVGVLVGLLLVVVTAILLFWNEGRAVQTYRSLNEGAGLVTDVDPNRVDASHEGKLIHLQGDLAARSPVTDPALGVSVPAARLVRKVEMYQWKEESHTETHKRVGGGEDRTTTYTYTRVWSDPRNASERFHVSAGHANPQLRFSRFEVVASDATVGAYRPGTQALEHLAASQHQPIEEAVAAGLRGRPGFGPAHAADGGLYLGSEPANPRIGDLRVTYTVAPLGPTSFVGRQSGADLVSYQTHAGDQLLMARSGLVPATAMFAQAQSENVFLTWILRIVGAVLMWVGFAMILRPIAVVGDVIPFVGSLLGAGTLLASFGMTAVLAPTVVAIAWLFYRPLAALAILAVGLGIVFGLRALGRQMRAGRPRPMPAGMAPQPAV